MLCVFALCFNLLFLLAVTVFVAVAVAMSAAIADGCYLWLYGFV
jgi:hypothetical protein